LFFLSVSNHSVEVKIIQVDFGQDEEIYEKVEENLKNLEIGVLVNNVGTGGGVPTFFADFPDLSCSIRDIVRINIVSLLKIC